MTEQEYIKWLFSWGTDYWQRQMKQEPILYDAWLQHAKARHATMSQSERTSIEAERTVA